MTQATEMINYLRIWCRGNSLTPVWSTYLAVVLKTSQISFSRAVCSIS